MKLKAPVLHGLFQLSSTYCHQESSSKFKHRKIQALKTVYYNQLNPKRVTLELLHQRLGHTNLRNILQMLQGQAITGSFLNKTLKKDCDACIPCIQGKSKSMSYLTNPERSETPLQRLCTDICYVSEQGSRVGLEE